MQIHLLFLTLFLIPALNASNFRKSHKYPTLDGELPIVIGHRGASGLRPAHTLAGYELAIDLGADVVEPDLVMTKDKVLICRHEPMLSISTNVETFPEFANRRTWRQVDGIPYYDWFAGDFTLKEIKKLRAKQVNAGRSTEYDFKFPVPTLDELISLVKRRSEKLGKTISIYPELKHPTFHKQYNLPLTDKLLETLKREGWTHKDSPVYVQSAEPSALQYVRSKSDVKIVQLFFGDDVDKEGNVLLKAPWYQPYDFTVAGDPRTYNDLAKSAGLDFIRTYADGIGPWMPFVISWTYQDCDNDGKPDDINGDGLTDSRDFKALPPTDLVARAHKRDLFVHVYTFWNEPSALLSDYKGDPKKEYLAYYRQGVDGVFSDYPGTAVEARKKFAKNWS